MRAASLSQMAQYRPENQQGAHACDAAASAESTFSI